MLLKALIVIYKLTLPKQMVCYISSVFPILGQQKFKITSLDFNVKLQALFRFVKTLISTINFMTLVI